LSDWSSERVAALRAVLRGRALAPLALQEAPGLEIVRSWPHGHVAAVLGTVRRLDLERLLAPKATPARALVVAMLVQRLVAPGSKLATARGLARETRSSTLSDVLALPAVDEDDLYAALDWLLPRQGAIEQALWKSGTLRPGYLSPRYIHKSPRSLLGDFRPAGAGAQCFSAGRGTPPCRPDRLLGGRRGRSARFISPRESFLPFASSPRDRLMSFKNSGWVLRASDSRSTYFDETIAATGLFRWVSAAMSSSSSLAYRPMTTWLLRGEWFS